MDDMPRLAATSPDEYSLTIDDALGRYEHAGHPRTARSIQRYCAKGHLDCLRQETPFGEKYLITPESVARHIAQIEELSSTTQRDMSRPVASSVAVQDRPEPPAPQPSTSYDVSRQDAADDRYTKLLESENEFLRGQVTTKDAQIKELSERSRETNILIGGLQKMLSPLLGMRDSRQQNESLHDIDAPHP